MALVSRDKPLYLALDQLNLDQEEFEEILLPELIAPIASGIYPNLYLVMVIREGAPYLAPVQGLSEPIPVLELSPFPSTLYQRYNREYLQFSTYPIPKDAEVVLDILSKQTVQKGQAWKPDDFNLLAGFLKKFS